MDYFDDTLQIPQFTDSEVADYFEKQLGRRIELPSEQDIAKLQAITHGNPFLIDKMVQLINSRKDDWVWDDEHWQPLTESFQRDKKHGLLLYATQRILDSHIPNDKAFWRLAIPREWIHRDMADILFPKSEFEDSHGLERLSSYEEKGIIFKGDTPDYYYMHDETRAALEAWAEYEKVWQDDKAKALHQLLAQWFDKRAGYREGADAQNSPLFKATDPNLLFAAYHYLQASPVEVSVEDKELPSSHAGSKSSNMLWPLIAGSIVRSNADKRDLAKQLSSEDKSEQALNAMNLAHLLEKQKEAEKHFKPQTIHWLQEQNNQGMLPVNWYDNTEFLIKACSQEALNDAALFSQVANKLEKGGKLDEAEQYYQRGLEIDPKHTNHLGNFANFQWQIRQDYNKAEQLYQQAIDADLKHANHLGNFATFLTDIRQDYDKAEQLYLQAIDAAPKDADHLSNFANFQWKVHQNHDKAEQLYQQAVDADPKDANSLGNFAQFRLAKGEKEQGKSLLNRAFEFAEHPVMRLELWFYRLAHFPSEYPEAEAEIRQLLDKGHRSKGWDFSRNIERAKLDSHPDVALLEVLAALISGASE